MISQFLYSAFHIVSMCFTTNGGLFRAAYEDAYGSRAALALSTVKFRGGKQQGHDRDVMNLAFMQTANYHQLSSMSNSNDQSVKFVVDLASLIGCLHLTCLTAVIIKVCMKV